MALRPHGRAAGGPHGAQEAHSGAATWQGGHATTWAPVWGATCRLVIEGAVTKLIGESTSLFNRNKRGYFLRVGLCSHMVLPVQDAWQLDERWIQGHRVKRVDVVDTESTRSPSTHMLQKGHK